MTFSVALLELRAGDVLVVRGPIQTPEMQAANFMRLKNLIPHGVRIMFIPPEVELSVLTKAEIEEKAAAA